MTIQTVAAPDSDYGPNYYRNHCGPLPYERSCHHWGVFFGGIAEMLIRSFRPNRVYDAGCAMGFLVEAFWDRGVECWGRDVSEFAISEVRADLRSFCSVGSIAEPVEGRFDLVTCIEVLEHMPEEAAMQAIKVMAQATDRILFSSSPTDLDEPTHINVRPMIYWLRLFAAESFAPVASYDPTFVTPHCVVLERAAQPPPHDALLAYGEIVRLRLQQGIRDQQIRDLYAHLAAVEKATRAEYEALQVRTASSAEHFMQREAALQAELGTLRGAAETYLQQRDAQAARSDAVTVELDEQRALAARGAIAHAAAAAAETQAVALNARLAARDAAYAQLQAVHLGLLSSSTWRLAWPLRVAAGWLPSWMRLWIRRLAKAIWWTVTLQLGTRLRQFVVARSARRRLAVETAGPYASHPGQAAAQDGILAPSSTSPMGAVTRSGVIVASPADHPVQFDADERAADGLPWVNILALVVDPALSQAPRLNVLVPGLAMKHMSGGPNTAVNLACRLAATGIAVRLVATSATLDTDPSPFWAHAATLSGTDPVALGMELVDASSHQTLRIGENDVFMATAWWTAQSAKYAVRHTRQKRFAYLIQDYEPLLHAASTQQALAQETYRLDHVPIVNSTLLRDFLVEQRVGRFADPAFAARALSFEPAVDAALFFPEASASDKRRRRLLFYARPQGGLRNLFELGVAALRSLIANGMIDHENWDFCGMGEEFAPVDLGSGCTLRALPWRDLATYAEQMRRSDVLLSAMLSPHPSYPPLEMAGCGRPVVTTVFSNKDAARLAAISPNIIGVEPTVEGLVGGLAEALQRRLGSGDIGMPATWSESLAGVMPRLHDAIVRLAGQALSDTGDGALVPGFDTWPRDGYGLYRTAMLADRSREYQDGDPGLVSLITPLWNTAPQFLDELAVTVFGQDSGPGFEWVIVDNGTTDAGTAASLAAIATHPCVRLLRVESNIGIVPALRMALENATHRYVMPVDSDDLLTPDCVRVMTTALRAAGFPPLAYSDEDKQLEGRQRDPYSKPDWDPVLFTHSCYIAHICAIDREAALELGCYSDRGADGSSDWDSFTRFAAAGHTPLHVPELLYTWRMHPLSTALDMGSKSYIVESQLQVLDRFLRSRDTAVAYAVAPSPLFGGTPDWRFVRDPAAARPLVTLLYGARAGIAAIPPGAVQVERCDRLDLAILLDHARRAAAANCRLHLLAAEARIADGSWPDEALAMFELFADTAIVGGRIHRDGFVVAADSYFGFDGPCGSPNVGRTTADPGYFAQSLKPHSCSAVSLQHCVIDPNFLVDVLPGLIARDVGPGFLFAWLGAAAQAAGRRCVYSPFLSASVPQPLEPPTAAELAVFVLVHSARIPDTVLLSPRLGLTRETAGQPVLRAVRAAQMRAARQPPALPYPGLHAAEVAARKAPSTAANTDISVLTTVYGRTDPALFRGTAESLLAQTVRFGEWLILAHGPTTPALDTVLAWVAEQHGVRILRRDTNLGIVGGLRLCLEAAEHRLVLPLDADDLLAPDALQIMAGSLCGAAFAFSDEDLIVDGALRSPIRRTAFDPVLNAADSTIWHLCAFERDAALRLGVYSDAGAEFCHDWDSVHRFAAADEVIRHVPHVLYHWRQHAISTSNSGAVNSGSLQSVDYMLDQVRSRQARPELYDIGPFPIFRGAEQHALLRRRFAPLPFCLLFFTHGASTVPDQVLRVMPAAEVHIVRSDANPGISLAALLDRTECAHVAILEEHLLPSEDGPWEAMRLFEMHADLAACAGRIIDGADRVVACCDTATGGPEWLGTLRTEPGDHAMALKPQSASGLVEGYAFCTVPVLRAAAQRMATQPQLSLGQAIAAVAAQSGLRLAYSPLIEASRMGGGRPS